MRKYRMAIHYTNNIVKIENLYNNMMINSKLLS